MTEATARIKINKLLEVAGWRFFDTGDKPANIVLELSVKIRKTDLDAWGNDFEQTSKGYIDFLLLDAQGFPLIVLEAKSESKNPFPPHRPGGQVRVKKPARRQGAGPEVRAFAELPLCHTLQWEPALLLGSGARQPLPHYLVSHTGFGGRLQEGPTQTGAVDCTAPDFLDR